MSAAERARMCIEMYRLWVEAGRPLDLTDFVNRADVAALSLFRLPPKEGGASPPGGAT